MAADEDLAMERGARAKGFWINMVSEGADCLMRAVSNALYFSETCHESIQNAVLAEFAVQLKNGLGEFTVCPNSAWLFAQTPFLPEFEKLNLEVVARICHVRVCVYSRELELLYEVNGTSSSGQQIHIIRLGDAYYASLERLERVSLLTLAQNVVLSAIEGIVEDHEFKLQSHNKDRLINFDYSNWRTNSGFLEPKGNAVSGDYRQNLYANNSAEFDMSNSVSERGSAIDSKDSVGSVIVLMMKARGKQTALWPASNSFEKNCEQFLNSSEHTSSLKDVNFELSNDSSLNGMGQESLEFDLVPERMDLKNGQMNMLSSRLCGLNNNLNKSVSIMDLNNIFGCPGDHQASPIIPENLASLRHYEGDSDRKNISNHRDLEFESVWNNAMPDFKQTLGETGHELYRHTKSNQVS
jgi:hypothetical protein